MNINLNGHFSEREINYINKQLSEIDFEDDNEALVVGEVTFVAYKEGEEILVERVSVL